MFKVDLPVEESVVLAVERRRTAEAVRQKRIFNTRNRLIGVDVAALERQVTERREREEMERQQDRAFDALRVMNDAVLMHQVEEEERRRAELSRELVQFRAIHQRAQDSRDADLNFNKQGTSELMSDSDFEFRPASMQVFQGGDGKDREKKRAQMEAYGRALKAQAEEKKQLRLQHKHTELLRDQEQLREDLRAQQFCVLEDECKRTAHVTLSKYNQAQATEKAEQQRINRLKEEGENFAEVWHMMTSDLLTECPEAAEKRGGAQEKEGVAPRVLTDRWKGMSAEQLSAIRRQREEQCADRVRQRRTEKKREAAWDCLQMEQIQEEEVEKQRAVERERERRTEMDRYNRQLAREQCAHQQYLDKKLYTNRPTADYFTQFNSSSR
ncbi:RIB43A-like with coiled-coils protein 1 isoform X1 [Megalops cyprinoides]|uniref:RIB43A-like with coiled-coils protein 1 isoform X1 n=1 Tax=Megalops cyprinoides TaxID=118141 RepID=UPI00186525D5|nr:RIB43A-like with coiled-coils protein 1 isoform X1 [Megalops cyprinoides]